MRGSLISAALIIALSASTAHSGNIIKFVDENGTVHFTDHLVPMKYDVYIKNAERDRLSGPRQPNRFSKEIYQAGNRHGVDRHLIQSVIQAESGYDPMAVSSSGARGLMQLMPETAAQYRVDNVHNPVQNIDGGTRYLKHLINKYDGNVKVALAAYNAGETVVAEYNGVPPFPETKTYIARVMEFYRELSGKKLRDERRAVLYRYIDENGTLILTDTPTNAYGLR
ncbi:MAG: transglycosylase SLT domain-containing protein [Nitrospinota bacterium]